ncbi:MAG: recombinase family protein [Anaerolineae bacterium]|nr:recombinase family protein [Anaerolineae bacterium]
MAVQTRKPKPIAPQAGWAVYLRTSSDENQKPELSRARQRFAIEKNVLERSDKPLIEEYVDVLTGKSPDRKGYQRLLQDARAGKFSHVIVERADRFGRNDTEALRAIDELHEFGVAVRFANQPDLDPMDPDDRVLVALSFTLARRESSLLGIRVKGGLRAKRESGGYIGQAPDGYINVEARTTHEEKKLYGRTAHWIELDPERAPIWRYAWDLLLEDRLTLEDIAEALHARGYRHRSGRPFIEVLKDGRRKANISSLSNVFHNWTYAGWIVSERCSIPPKTLRGSWEPLVTTEEMERGLAILARRNQRRSVRRTQDYLLKGMVYYSPAEGRPTIRLSGSTSNAGRSGGGTPYYRDARAGGISFLCTDVDVQIPTELRKIQIDPDMIPLIRASYTQELAEKLGHAHPDERQQLQAALKAVDEEEGRMARLLASGRITEAVWDSLWAEWQDRRSKLRQTIETLDEARETHVSNLDSALGFIAKIGVLYNGLERADQKELLRQVVQQVIVNAEGTIRLELRAPFAYLKELTDEIREVSSRLEGSERGTKTDSPETVRNGAECSSWLQDSWNNRNLSEQSPDLHRSVFIQRIQFPYHAHLVRLSTLD